MAGTSVYDYLILAAGATHAYFGHDEWAAIAPGIENARRRHQIRRRILLAFESAEYEGSEEARRAALDLRHRRRRPNRRRTRRGDQGDRSAGPFPKITSTSIRGRRA